MTSYPPQATRPAHRASRFLRREGDSLLTFLIAFSLYIYTLSPGVLPADAGEFQAVVPLLGVAHPPGFSLYTMVGKLFITLVPAGAPAYRLNLLSALAGAMTLVVVGRAVRRLTGSRWPGLAAALALGASTTFWSQSTTANIRSLAALLTALGVHAWIAYRLAPTANRLALLVFTLSTAVVHHLSVAFIAGVLALAALWLTPLPVLRTFVRPEARLREGGRILLAGLAPLIVLLYFPLRGAAGAFLAPPGLDTPAGLLRHVMATGFGGDLFAFASLAALPDRMAILLNIFLFQFNPALLALLAAGLLACYGRDGRLALALTAAIALHCFIAITYRAPQTVEYLLPAYVVLAIASGVGLWKLSTAIETYASRAARLAGSVATPLLRLVVPGSVFVASSLLLARNFPAYLALAGDTSAHDYAQAALQAAPAGGSILSNWHYATPMWYLQQVEGLRRDVAVAYVFPRGESLARNWVDAVRANAALHGTLVTNLYPAEYSSLPYRFEPAGPIWRAAAPTTSPSGTGLSPHQGGWTLYEAGPPSVAAVAPGQTLAIPVAWLAPADPHDINFFVQLLGPDGGLYGQMDVSRAAGQIAPHEVIAVRYYITVNVDAQPGDYALVAGAYLPDGTRLAPDFTELGRVAVVPRAAPPATRHPNRFGLVAGYDYDLSLPGSPRLYVHWRLDGKPHQVTLSDEAGSLVQAATLPPLSGYVSAAFDLPPGPSRLTLREAGHAVFVFPAPGPADRYVSFGPIVLTRAAVAEERDGSYRVDLDWLADRPLTDDLIVKVDLVGADYSWRAQSDSVPAGGAIPTLKWIPGIVVHDRHRLAPAGPAPAAFQLAVYDHFTQVTLPILDSRLALAGPIVPLGAIQP